MEANVPGAPPGAGALGDEHVHASVLVKIFGDKFDFLDLHFKSKVVIFILKDKMEQQFIDILLE